MTTLGNENARSPIDKLKKRAYTIQSRMKELGHQVSLAHAYEVLAASSGFRNWPTMKSKAETSEGGFHIGHEVKFVRDVKGNFNVGNPKALPNENRPISIPIYDCTDHFEVIGTHGSMRTQVLVGIAANAIERGDSLVYFDAFGDVSMYHRLRKLADRHGRADDVLAISLLSSAPGSVRYNPFASASAEDLAEILTSWPEDEGEHGGDLDLWRGRANAMLIGVLRPLIWLRDKGEIKLNPETLMSFLSLDKMIALQERASKQMPAEIHKSLSSYLQSLAGFHRDAGTMQTQTTLDQHGYLQLIFVKLLEPLATTYGYIFQHHENLTSFEDVISDKKILLVLFPYLDRGSDAVGRLLRLFYLDLVRALKRRDSNNKRHLVTAVVDNAERHLPRNLDRSMADAGDAHACLVFGWEKSPFAPSLKKSVSVHLSEDGRATVVTKSERHIAAMRYVNF